MTYTPKLFVALRGDALAVKALQMLQKLDPGRVTLLVLDEAQLPTTRLATELVVLFTFSGAGGQVVKYPGNHLRVLRADDRSRPPVRQFEPPAWTRQMEPPIPIHQCVALRPRDDDESDDLFAEALCSAYNQLTGAKVKVRPPLAGTGAPPKVTGVSRRDSTNPSTLGGL